ncbi:unnamed protein product, partial [Ectocarpus fasciculatus]
MDSRYHRVVGVRSGASIADVRAAYLRKARELHPDKNRGVDTTVHFQELQAAYDSL